MTKPVNVCMFVYLNFYMFLQACDNTAYLWDMRTGEYVQYFEVFNSQTKNVPMDNLDS